MFRAVDRVSRLAAASALVLVLPVVAAAQDAPATPAAGGPAAVRVSSERGPLRLTPPGSEARRQQLTAFSARWRADAGRQPGVDVAAWEERLADEFLRADPLNVAAALQRVSFEAAMAALHGAGHRVTDSAAENVTGTDTARAGRLGDVGADMVYTPLTPCRIVDTRSITNGRLAALTPRLFRALPTAGVYTDQGGAASDCGMTGQAPGAVVLNVTVVAPSGAGYATIYPSGTSAPLAASVNYTAGAIVNNSIVTAIPDPSPGTDFAIVSFASTDVVVDLVGFFDTPEVTPVECLETAAEPGIVAGNGTTTATPAACPAGYTAISANCTNPSGGLAPLAHSVTSCTLFNPTINPLAYDASRTCCRVPGR